MVVPPVLLAGGGCVVPPPLDVETTDASINAPPVITEVRDTTLTPLRPPATLTVNRAVPGQIGLTVYDVDVTDDLIIQLFVDYDPMNPRDANVNCAAAPTDMRTPSRTTSCVTTGLCGASDVGLPHILEIEIYDTPPLDNAPFRTPTGDGLFSTWTLDLACIDQTP